MGQKTKKAEAVWALGDTNIGYETINTDRAGRMSPGRACIPDELRWAWAAGAGQHSATGCAAALTSRSEVPEAHPDCGESSKEMTEV